MKPVASRVVTRKVGRPIVHKDAYSEAIEVKLLEFFRDAIFGPLLELVASAGIEPDAKDQGPQGNLNAKIDAEPDVDDWVRFAPEAESLGIARRNMPQIRAADRDRVRDHLLELGVRAIFGRVDPRLLRPTQDEFSPAKVAAAVAHAGTDRPIFVAKGERILDGHHQWLAMLERGVESVPIVSFVEDVVPLITHAKLALGSRENAKPFEASVPGPLRAALKDGRLWYADGQFYGTFTAEIARELRRLGATFDATAKAFRFPADRLPYDLRDAVFASVERAEDLHKRVTSFLEEAGRNAQIAATGIEVDVALSRIRGDLWRQLEETIPIKALDLVEVSADVTPSVRDLIDREFKNDLDLSIKNFLSTELPELREQVEANAFAGYRADRLGKIIEARYGVAKRKAAFLAEQETSLLVSKFREARYREIGSEEYVWSDSHDGRVRHDHHELNGKRFFWSSPPITNRKTGARNNPGEDFRCRCVALPVLVFPT